MRYRKYFKLGLASLVFFNLILMLSSCKVIQPHKMPDMSVDNKLFRDLVVSDTSNMANIPWKKLFSDPHLLTLIEEAVNNNRDLKIAEARMKKADANLRQSKAAFLPSLSLNAQAIYQKNDLNGISNQRIYEVYGSASWEIDIWGKMRNANKAQLAAFFESAAFKRAVQTQLIADVATKYYTLLAYDAQLKITMQTLEKRKADVETMTLLKKTDVVTGADLVLSEANRYSAEVTIPDLKQSIYETENALCLLLGRNPGPIERGLLTDQEISTDLKYGVPGQMLANRPDVQEAEFRFRYYFNMTNVARTYFYPALTLSATGGYSVTDLSYLFNAPMLALNIAGGLVQPILNYGQNKQRLRGAQADEEEYLITYRQKLLQASNEVVNSLHSYQMATEKMTIRTKQIESLEKSVDYTLELLKYTSNTNYTDVLTAEMNLLSAQLSGVGDKLQQLQSVVDLYQSLGGGWKN